MRILKTASFELAVQERGDRNAQRIALILPGRLDTKDYDCFNKHLEFFANLGYRAISFDPPGTWESPGGIELFTTTHYIKAVHELIEYCGSKPTILLGHSRGGAVASLVGTSNPLVEAIITLMESFGAPSPPDKDEIKGKVYIDYRDLPPGDKPTPQAQLKKFEVPLTYFADGARYNDAETLKKCRKPKLIFYGTDDEFNSPSDVLDVYKTLPKPKMIHRLDCDHDYRYHPELFDEIHSVIHTFLQKCVTPGRPSGEPLVQ